MLDIWAQEEDLETGFQDGNPSFGRIDRHADLA